jgi:hypothetical protein
MSYENILRKRNRIFGYPDDDAIDWGYNLAIESDHGQLTAIPVNPPRGELPLLPCDYQSPARICYLLSFWTNGNYSLRATLRELIAKIDLTDYIFPIEVIARAATEEGARLLRIFGFVPVYEDWYIRAIDSADELSSIISASPKTEK